MKARWKCSTGGHVLVQGDPWAECLVCSKFVTADDTVGKTIVLKPVKATA
jgi:hypothetical protein